LKRGAKTKKNLPIRTIAELFFPQDLSRAIDIGVNCYGQFHVCLNVYGNKKGEAIGPATWASAIK
jgi:hypothetical protein